MKTAVQLQAAKIMVTAGLRLMKIGWKTDMKSARGIPAVAPMPT